MYDPFWPFNAGFCFPPSSVGGDLLQTDLFKNADVSQLVEDLIDDEGMAKFFDEEFEVSCRVRSCLACHSLGSATLREDRVNAFGGK